METVNWKVATDLKNTIITPSIKAAKTYVS